MKDLGAAKKILGMEIQRNKTTCVLCLTQKSYIEKVLEGFGMKNAKPVSTLLGAHFILSVALSPQSKNGIDYISHIPYSNTVNSIIYAMIYTRSDISYVFSVVTRFMSNLRREHWQASTVVLLTTKAEYIVVYEVIKEAI
ncbi:hypothetical protein MANES_13G085878v8 [Manihot esculenta]|uniref:Uncharacterized protein n=1 Tax=Manihot esculenta TaxID=3983 RepID=A0ACB7GLJ7_MANES|nr:hypothetical protein MANES_13G085878v8 [Manihot esculenta]